MTISLDDTRADLEQRRSAPATGALLKRRLRKEGGLFIPCPHCSRRRDEMVELPPTARWHRPGWPGIT